MPIIQNNSGNIRIFAAMKHQHFISYSLILAALFLYAPTRSNAQEIKGNIMGYSVSGNDTTYLDELPPAKIHPRQTMSKREWVKYYKRVHNFSKAYPYALVVSRVIKETDSTFEARNYNKRERDKALREMKEDVIHDFTPLFRQLTLNQGLMMIRLIDRECGLTPYYIIKHYFNGATAGFWQGVAKLYKGNLKQPYDKFGEDKDLEELVGYWEREEFDELYKTVFGKPRPEIVVPDRFK